MAQRDVIRLLQQYIMILNEAGLKIKKAFLYGSYARNEANLDSDIDVMLISENFDDNNIEIKAKAWQLTNKVDRRIEPFTLGMKRFLADDDSALIAEIRKDGIEIAIV